jgi:putative FmdB family regulatory protein
MPLYEYQCDTCGSVFEKIQKFSDEPLVVHEDCGGAVRRLLSAPALKFKGTGWYITDYAKGNGTSASSKASSEGGEGKSETKSEGKPESKTTTTSDAKPESKKTSS